MGAYSMIKCEGCKKVYKDDQVKCPQCGLERDIYDPPDRRKGPGAQFRKGEGLAGWAEVYRDDSRDTAARRPMRLLEQIVAMSNGNMNAGWPRHPLSRIWKRGGYR
jgi:hypothetical protein